MGVLSDTDIYQLLKSKMLEISPLDVSQIQGASVDLSLGSRGQRLLGGNVVLGMREGTDKPKYEDIFFSGDGYKMEPGDFILVATREYLQIPQTCNAKIYNKNSLIQLGLYVFGDYINPGYQGHMPLAIQNLGKAVLTLTEGIRICQLEISTLTTSASCSYSEQRKKTAKSGDNPLSDFLQERISDLSRFQ